MPAPLASANFRVRADLVARVAGVLGVAQAGQDLSAEDAALIDAQIDPCCDSLAAREIIYLTSRLPTWKIPNAIFNELAACVAACCIDFGQPLDPSQAEAALRRMQHAGPTYEPLRVEYF